MKNLYPFEYTQSVFLIDYNKLYQKGYRGIIFDIDNTLVPHGEGSTKEVDKLFKHINDVGIKTLLLTNNDEKRVKKFLKNIDSLYICDAQKPKVKNYLYAVDLLKLKREEVIFIGDQIFTDIYGANKSHIDNILVEYIHRSNETKIGKKRYIEKIILKFYKKSNKYQKRIGDIFI